MNSIQLLILMLSFGSVAHAQLFQFNGLGGINSSTDDALDGFFIADRYGGTSYSGYAGEMALIFANDGDLPSGLGVPRGTFVGDVDGSYAGKLGLVVFCTDSNTGFRNSTNPADVFSYEAHSLASAESRYLAEGVSWYRTGGLRRAAYMIENFYGEVHAAGSVAAAALQAAIWEVLTDENPSLMPDDGNYFLRNDTTNPLLNFRTDQIAMLTDTWFADAIADGWGGPDHDPGSRVAFWLDPTNIHLNQTVISLNPDAMTLSLIPEPSSGMLVMLGGLMLVMRRRRTAE